MPFSPDTPHKRTASNFQQDSRTSEASTIIAMGEVHYKLHDVEWELERYEAALAVYRETLGEDHPHVAGTLKNIGMVLAEQGQLDKAMDQFRRPGGSTRPLSTAGATGRAATLPSPCCARATSRTAGATTRTRCGCAARPLSRAPPLAPCARDLGGAVPPCPPGGGGNPQDHGHGPDEAGRARVRGGDSEVDRRDAGAGRGQ